MNKHQQFQQKQTNQTFQIDLKDATKSICECGSQFYIQAIMVYTVSPILSPNGQELIAQQPALICAKCFEPHKKS